jgi:hypothetical protein
MYNSHCAPAALSARTRSPLIKIGVEIARATDAASFITACA